MARTHKSSPYTRNLLPTSPIFPPRTLIRSPLRHRSVSGESTRRNFASRPPRSNARLFRSTRNLQIVHEDSPNLAPRHSRTSHAFLGHRGAAQDKVEDEDDHDDKPQSGDSFFHWEEESTLLSDLMEDGPDMPDNHKIESLANSLQTSFDFHGRQLKKEIAVTFVPTVNHIKEVYRTIDDQVDVSFGKGVLTFNNACKQMETMAITEQDELSHAYMTAQANFEDLFNRLKDAYAHRASLWSEFETAMNEAAEPTLETLRATPGKIERTIANLEKHVKMLEKDNTGSASAAEKKMKGLLSKLG